MAALRRGATYLRTLPHVTYHDASVVMQFSSPDVQHAQTKNCILEALLVQRKQTNIEKHQLISTHCGYWENVS